MIERAQTEEEPLAWEAEAPGAGGVVFVAVSATGRDPALDSVTRVEALKRVHGSARWETLDRACGPDARASIAFAELAAFCADAAIVSDDALALADWARHFGGVAESLAHAIGSGEIASTLFPTRARASIRAAEFRAGDVRGELEAAVAEFLGLEPAALELATTALSQAWRKLRHEEPEVARRLGLTLWLAEHPSRWSETSGARSVDGSVSASATGAPEEYGERARELVERVRPRCAEVGDAWRVHETIPVEASGAAPLDERDLALLDTVFETHLVATFDGAGSYREGQHAVAREVAATLGSDRLLLVHAPTGTGKTLAYLVPAILWSSRNRVRVGVSTFTRALQEQAVERDVPRALDALARAGFTPAARVVALKGRANYLCWRALRLHAPDDDEDGAAWLAWTSLVLFALADRHGDLDRFPRRHPLLTKASARAQREVDATVEAVRAGGACCNAREDRATCAAEVARLCAERSHVVVVNHALALALQPAFQHAIFDECEHLHDQAHGVWSRTVTARAIADSLARLRQPGRAGSRALLDRVARMAVEGREVDRVAAACASACVRSGESLARLRAALDGFRRWRRERDRERQDGEPAPLREFVAAAARDEAPDVAAAARELLDARIALEAAGAELEAGLGELASNVDRLRARSGPRLRRSLELARGDVALWLEALRAWIPMVDGEPKFSPEIFHDVDEDARGEPALAARVLLPNEALGRHFHPRLASAAFLSATTYLRGGFECGLGYLGLDRAARPAPEEERAPRDVRTIRAGDPFDYTRVLVCVPSDAPAYAASSAGYHAYVRRFIAHLGERTRGRVLALFTNADEVQRTGAELSGFFRARGIPLYFQNMPGLRKEEVGELFRARTDAVLLGVDTFWYGADFPGRALEYVAIVKLPYGVPDRYHLAQCAALGASEQRRRIYLPRALAKFRQGFGRLMRRETDRGCVFVLDARILRGANKLFLAELPLAGAGGAAGARLLVDTTERCVSAALEHMDLAEDVRARGLDPAFDASPPPLERNASDEPF